MTAYKEECRTVLPGKQNKAKKDRKKIPLFKVQKGSQKTDTNLTSAAGLNDRLAHSAGLIRIENQKLVFALLQGNLLRGIDI